MNIQVQTTQYSIQTRYPLPVPYCFDDQNFTQVPHVERSSMLALSRQTCTSVRHLVRLIEINKTRPWPDAVISCSSISVGPTRYSRRVYSSSVPLSISDNDNYKKNRDNKRSHTDGNVDVKSRRNDYDIKFISDELLKFSRQRNIKSNTNNFGRVENDKLKELVFSLDQAIAKSINSDHLQYLGNVLNVTSFESIYRDRVLLSKIINAFMVHDVAS